MQLTDTFCYLVFMISITATCAQAETKTSKSTLAKAEKRMTKRDAAIIIDNFPMEPIVSKKPKVLYRRLSKQRYRAPKPRYGPPRVKYGPPPKYVTRNPNKKYKIKKVSPKYGSPPTKRSPKPRYPVYGKQNINKPKYNLSKKKRPHGIKKPHLDNNYQPLTNEPVGFGEPPSHYHSTPSYAEPPVDSYGAPLKLKEPYPTAEDLDNLNYDLPEKNVGQDYSNWPDPTQPDNNFAYSNQFQTFMKPGLSTFDNEDIAGEEENLNNYSDVYKYNLENNNFAQFPKKLPDYNMGDFHKLMNRPWKAPSGRESDEQMLVGGQYAEPPARYVPKFQPSAPMFLEDEDNFNPGSRYVDPESATVSPYVNYKNSNMAFSPQNLNDAFSIVDKRR